MKTNFLKWLVLGTLLTVSVQAKAGFASGIIVGSMLSNSSNKAPTENPVILSEKHDIIMCKKVYNMGEYCEETFWDKKLGASMHYTPARYAGDAGYKTLYRVGVVFHDGNEYIVMEVSR